MSTKDGNLYDILRSGLAGGTAGCVAKTAVAPLDRVKILFQTSNPDFKSYAGTWTGVFRAARDIYADGGARGLLQGHSATLVRVFPYAAIKFMTYDAVHDFLMPTRESETNLRRFAAGSISGTISVFFTYPLELIRVRMAFATRHAAPTPSTSAPSPVAPPRPSIRQIVSLVYHEPAFANIGLFNFYRGFTVTIVGMVPYAGTSFLTWGYLRAKLLPPPPPAPVGTRGRNPRARPTPLADLALGAVSGAIAQTASYPFEVVRRRMQVGGLTSPGRWMRWGETVAAVYRQAAARAGPPPFSAGVDAAGNGGVMGAGVLGGRTGGLKRTLAGLRGFYVGLSIGYLKVVPMTAVSFMTWEAGKRFLGS